ncbi:hypothetical protein [Marinicella meishanensis]|uniref:hypothetical protein n=1 Tax=Marinicella meishanensis TaxID=2873263 RepID=UPI001CC1193C|nr:hypothetical protein [Marinicella sp. NBU2979]
MTWAIGQLILAFVSTGLISFVLFYVMLKSSQADTVTAMDKPDKATRKRVKADLKQQQWSMQNVMMSKWVDFGGGFYGVVAVLTYLVVEFWEVVDFLTSEATVLDTLAALGVGDVVNFFINSLMNFITAIAWPAYWLNKVDGAPVWVWFVVAYAGYYTGQVLAKSVIKPYAQE